MNRVALYLKLRYLVRLSRWKLYLYTTTILYIQLIGTEYLTPPLYLRQPTLLFTNTSQAVQLMEHVSFQYISRLHTLALACYRANLIQNIPESSPDISAIFLNHIQPYKIQLVQISVLFSPIYDRREYSRRSS